MANEVNGILNYKDKSGTVNKIYPVTKTENVEGLESALNEKVSKVSGKGLSTNDYTTSEKNKLAGIADNANNYTLPAATSSALGGVKIGSNISNSSGTISLSKANVTAALGYTPPTQDTTYSVATTSAAGLMSASDKTKLENTYTKSEVNTALNGKVSTQSGYGLISDADKSQIQTNKTSIAAAETAIAGKASAEIVTQLQNDIAVQEARMDQLVGTVPAGTVDEIADARVTADGKTETNLGNAIRSQVSSLKSDLNFVDYTSAAKIDSNMFLSSELITGYGYTQAGKLVKNSAYCATRLYPRNEDCYIKSNIKAYRICRYDASKNFLGFQDGGASLSAAGEYVAFMYLATEDLTKLEIKNIKNGWQKTDNLFEIKGKNLFQKNDLLYGFGYRQSDGLKIEDGKYCITPIYERKPATRLQSNINFYRAIVYNSDMTFRKVVEGVHNVAEGKYVAFMYTVDTDLSELMICNTKISDIQDYKKPTYIPSENVLIKDNDSVYNTDNLLYEYMTYVKDDGEDELPYVSFIGTTGKNKTWIQKDIPCTANKIVNVEFNASSTADDDFNVVSGGAFYVKFYDNDDVVINDNKYNMSVIKNNYFGYHKYAIAAPRGTAYARLTLFTRGETTIKIKYLNISIANHVVADGTSVIYDGHLGSWYSAPKNTMPAFETAYRMGYRSIITVPRYTKDGVMVALHDRTIDATSNGSGNVDSYSYEELQNFDFGSWFSKYYSGTKIPKIEAIMKFAKISGMEIVLSLHDKCIGNNGISELYALSKKYGLLKNIMFKSYFIDELDEINRIFGTGAKYDYIISSYTNNIRNELTSRNYINYVEIDNLTNLTEEIAVEIHGMGVETISPIIASGIDIHKSIDLGCSRFTSDQCANIVLPF